MSSIESTLNNGQHTAQLIARDAGVLRINVIGDPVEPVASRIGELLDQRGFLGDRLSTADLREINDLLVGTRDSGFQLNADQVNRVLASLTDDQLSVWASEMVQSPNIPFRGGLSAQERGELFSELGRSLDGEQAARFSAAFDHHDHRMEFGATFINQAGPAAVADFAIELGPQAADEQRVQLQRGAFGSGGLNLQADPDALTIARALGALSGAPAEFSRAYAALGDQAGVLDQVFRAAEQQTTVQSTSGRIARFDAQPLVEMIEAAAQAPLDIRVDVVTRAANSLDGIAEISGLLGGPLSGGVNSAPGARAAQAEISAAVGQLLNADPINLVTTLRGEDRSGEVLTSFAREAVRSGQVDSVADLIQTLQTGPGGSPLDWLAVNTAADSQPANYGNAVNLGYTVGSVLNGIRALSVEEQQQLAPIKLIADTLLGQTGVNIVDKFGGAVLETVIDARITRSEISDISEIGFPIDEVDNSTLLGAYQSELFRVTGF
ncbi:MAG: hypothetical protein ACXIUM_12020 [Wenzhouxiangella sp.]